MLALGWELWESSLPNQTNRESVMKKPPPPPRGEPKNQPRHPQGKKSEKYLTKAELTKMSLLLVLIPHVENYINFTEVYFRALGYKLFYNKI